MVTVFQGETGGTVAFSYDTSAIMATSGYLVLVAGTHYIYTLDGYVASGQLFIRKDQISSIPADRYTGFPQIVDNANDVWYLDEIELEVEFIPDNPQAYVTTVPSIIQRVTVLEEEADSTVDHGALTGLGDDDHTQYLTNTRGDTRYWALSTDLATQVELNSEISARISADLLLAPLASPALSGTPTAPTPVSATDSTQIATTAFVHAVVALLINASPATLDTLKELADAVGNDPDFAVNIATSVAAKLAKASNLSDLLDASTARTNLGLGTAATQNSSAFDASGAASSAVATHEADTTAVHGITDTSLLARINIDNQFTAGQGIRAALSGSAAGVYIPWIAGDVLPTVVVGSSDVSNTQVGMQITSSGNVGVVGISSSSSGVHGQTISGPSGAIVATVTDTGTTNVPIGVSIRHNSSGTPAANFGVALPFRLQSDTTINQDAGQIAVSWSTATHATRTAVFALWSTISGTLAERARIGSTGVFSIRGTSTSTAAGIHAPWISGDTLPTAAFGSATSGNNQDAVSAISNSGTGVRAVSTTGLALEARIDDTGTANAPSAARIRHNTTGVPAAGFGVSTVLSAHSSNNTLRDLVTLASVWTDATDASRKARMTLSVSDTAAREGLRIEADGSVARLGLYGVTAVARQTAAAAATDLATAITLVNDLRTKLIALGALQ
jgi:hypothetical protein